MSSPYRDEFRINGYWFGEGEKTVAIVGAMRGDEIGQIVSPLEGKILSRVVSPCHGFLFTIRAYPIVYEGSLMARIFKTNE